MCGIIGCLSQRDCRASLQKSLTLLEYRGYDSVGVALIENEDMHIAKTVGGVEQLKMPNIAATTGIGHTRWATHGGVSTANAHPHCSENFALVHNGIISNYLALKEQYLQGVELKSTTDSEILVHLIEKCYQSLLIMTVQEHKNQEKEYAEQVYSGEQTRQIGKEGQNLFVQAVRLALQKVQGSYAIAVVSKKFPKQMVASRYKCPLLVAKGADKADFICSDMQAVAMQATEFVSLQEQEIVHIVDNQFSFYRQNGSPIKRKMQKILPVEQSIKKVQSTFMEKEIAEIPKALKNCKIALENSHLKEIKALFQRAKAVHIIGCGTSYHAGLVFQTVLGRYSQITSYVHVASELDTKQKNIQKGDVVFVLSQSGETADCLQAVKVCKRKGCKIVLITNAQYSSLGNSSDFTIWMRAGQEIAVAATKSYLCQLFTLYHILPLLLEARQEELPKFLKKLDSLPKTICKVYAHFTEIERLAVDLKGQQAMAVLGRGLDLPTAREAALKIKEITYIFAEAYPAGELKHGSLALVDENFCVLALATDKNIFAKMENALLEVKSRKGKTILLSPYTSTVADYSLPLPKLPTELMPFVAIVPLQYFACKLSIAKGIQPDKPKNLAKSVTVE